MLIYFCKCYYDSISTTWVLSAGYDKSDITLIDLNVLDWLAFHALLSAQV